MASPVSADALFGEAIGIPQGGSLSPSDGERVGVRGAFNCVVTDEFRVPAHTTVQPGPTTVIRFRTHSMACSRVCNSSAS